LEARADSRDRLSPALAVGKRIVETRAPLAVELCPRQAVHPAVVAFAQPPIEQHRDLGAEERDLRGLDGAVQVGGEDDVDAVVPSPRAQLPGLLAPGC